MAEEKKKPCHCGAVLAIIIIVLSLLALRGTLNQPWVGIAIIVLAAMAGICSLMGCCCAKFCCKPKEDEQGGSCCSPPAEPPPTQ